MSREASQRGALRLSPFGEAAKGSPGKRQARMTTEGTASLQLVGVTEGAFRLLGQALLATQALRDVKRYLVCGKPSRIDWVLGLAVGGKPRRCKAPSLAGPQKPQAERAKD